MSEFKRLWKETKEFGDSCEREITDKYIHFLREVARHYISKGKRVFFRENRVAHYGEGGFGWMVIESDDDGDEVFGAHIPEIRFEEEANGKNIGGYIEIKKGKLEDIKYKI